MPRTKLSEYSTTNSDNSDIEGINIAEGCAPSGINNAIRELMVHLKEFQTGASGDAFTFAGGVLISGTANTITGNVLMSGTNTITGSTTATFAAGAVGTPSIAAHGDTNTGIFFPAADTIAFAEGGAEAMRIDSSGNVGIGTTSPSQKLHLAGGSNRYMRVDVGTTAAGLVGGESNLFILGYNTVPSLNNVLDSSLGTGRLDFGNSSGGYIALLTGATNTAPSERMRIDSSGNVGIGTSSPSSRLHVVSGSSINQVLLVADGASTYSNYRVTNANSTGALSIGVGGSTVGASALQNNAYVWNTGNSALSFGTNDQERARITSGGFFKASNTGTYASSTSSYHELRNSTGGTYIAYMQNTSTDPLGLVIEFSGATPNGTANRFIYMGDATTMRAEFRSNGGLANYSANNVNLASDQRLKKDISPLATTWDKVKAIEVVNFRYKDCNEGDPLLYGVIAQQVQPIVPELVVVTQEAKEAVEAKEEVLDEEGNVIEPAVAAKEATPEYFGIREQPMYWLAIKALQEAMTRIEALEAEVAAMKAQ